MWMYIDRGADMDVDRIGWMRTGRYTKSQAGANQEPMGWDGVGWDKRG